MEYTGATTAQGGLTPYATGTGFSALIAGTSPGIALPMFDMPSSSFNLLRTWYGKGVA